MGKFIDTVIDVRVFNSSAAMVDGSQFSASMVLLPLILDMKLREVIPNAISPTISIPTRINSFERIFKFFICIYLLTSYIGIILTQIIKS